eukprot:GILJ01004787.1.p1 GENE.GILJ01004787.1~~GILJ01004787.1.p1  ORF type:complete len:537 (-),score=77.19 GILJ01004787.1:248-1813(-)
MAAIGFVSWIILAVLVVVLLVFAYGIVRYYTNKYEAQALPTLATTVCLTMTFLCVFIIPLDIFSVSSAVDSGGVPTKTPEEIAAMGQSIRILYYFLYSSLLAFAFCIVPFAYFYYEEDDLDVTVREKMWAAFKYTICFLVVIVVLVVIGVVIKHGKVDGDRLEWLNKLIAEQDQGDTTICFVIGCLTVVGVILWNVYSSMGIAHVPFRFVKAQDEETRYHNEEVNSDLAVSRDQIRGLYANSVMTGRKMTKKDKKRLELLKKQERLLSNRQTRLLRDENGIWNRCGPYLRPLELIIGLFLLGFSLLIFTSLFIATLDRAMNSTCGIKCGYAIVKTSIFNPIDQLFLAMSKAFPLDIIGLGGMCLFICLSTLSAVTWIGVRFLWIKLYTIRRGASMPQALLLAATVMVYIVFVLTFQVVAIAPQYATFGTQVYKDKTGALQSCTLDQTVSGDSLAQGTCVMSQVATFVNRIQGNTQAFGIIFFFSNWVFLALYAIWFTLSVFKNRSFLSRKSGLELDDVEGF